MSHLKNFKLYVRSIGAGITHRAARSGRAESRTGCRDGHGILVRLSSSTRSQLFRTRFERRRVVAVITLESRRLNGFNDSHLEFVEKLATRPDCY